MRLDLYGFLFLLLLLSCKDNKPSVTEKIADEIPEEFYEFYNKFSSDSAYQMQHIIFPLDGKSAEDSLRNQAFLWQKDTWIIHQPFDDMGGFSQSWYNVNSVIIEKKLTTTVDNLQWKEDGHNWVENGTSFTIRKWADNLINIFFLEANNFVHNP